MVEWARQGDISSSDSVSLGGLHIAACLVSPSAACQTPPKHFRQLVSSPMAASPPRPMSSPTGGGSASCMACAIWTSSSKAVARVPLLRSLTHRMISLTMAATI